MTPLPKLVQALLDPKIYPDATQGVELVQTQMSFVFLAGDYVYKVKKPVNLGYLDYTTLDKRRFYCRRAFWQPGSDRCCRSRRSSTDPKQVSAAV